MRLAFIGLTFVILAGCSSSVPSRPTVQGKLVYNGKPVGNKTLNLVFDAPAGQTFSKMLMVGADGTFSGEVPQPGNYKLVITDSLAVMERRKEADPNDIPLPPKYKTAESTDLQWKIEAGSNKKEFELKD